MPFLLVLNVADELKHVCACFSNKKETEGEHLFMHARKKLQNIITNHGCTVHTTLMLLMLMLAGSREHGSCLKNINTEQSG